MLILRPLLKDISNICHDMFYTYSISIINLYCTFTSLKKRQGFKVSITSQCYPLVDRYINSLKDPTKSAPISLKYCSTICPPYAELINAHLYKHHLPFFGIRIFSTI